jgi:hypothetical protein
MKVQTSILNCLIMAVLFPSVVGAQTNAPSYRWTVVEKGTVGGTLTTKISIAPESVKRTRGSVHVWMLTEHYRASDDYREKYYGEFSIDCRTGEAREVSAVFDRFGRGKPPRYGPRREGFNDYSNVFDANSNYGEAGVLQKVARKNCPK